MTPHTKSTRRYANPHSRILFHKGLNPEHVPRVQMCIRDRHGIASFIYVEPMSHWLAMPRDVPRTYDDALSVLNKDLAGARGKQAAEMAAATLTSGIENAEGLSLIHI